MLLLLSCTTVLRPESTTAAHSTLAFLQLEGWDVWTELSTPLRPSSEAYLNQVISGYMLDVFHWLPPQRTTYRIAVLGSGAPLSSRSAIEIHVVVLLGFFRPNSIPNYIQPFSWLLLLLLLQKENIYSFFLFIGYRCATFEGKRDKGSPSLLGIDNINENLNWC